ncbi:hypothetical protein MH117_06035 [Paenibacillus sp. ACRRX]|uniref:GntR family transcriptional regulator YhfZ n=1 Tax=Paenibacillus sp. ACRRX TaxID=2918206 RepID=UPI001EF72707|nr:GntR family transcriptional regulator YhfZ [Paenibacillus sp. ACRRX]MCG7406972.1 hypothetical protein [Paenibacillus sp. ACRRX]
MNTQLYQKSGLALMHLARIMMTVKKGDRLQTITEYEKEIGFARGTIQNAINRLKQSGAIELESKGHSGTYVTDIDYKKVWEHTGWDICSGAMPLPYSKLYEGMATGLYRSFQQFGAELSMAYVRGSRIRLQMLSKGAYDFAVVSLLAAQQAIASGEEIEIALQFGEHSYLSKHVLVVADPHITKIEDGMTVAIDRKSTDQSMITQRLCEGKNITLVEMSYSQIVSSIMSRRIDVGVWNLDEIKDKELPVIYRDITDIDGIDNVSTAAVVTAKSNKGMRHIIKEIIAVDTVLNIQQQVVRCEIDPSY